MTLSFFDEGDEPRRPPRTEAHEPLNEHQTVLIRRAVAAGVGAVFLILLVLAANSCVKGGRERALREYNQNVGRLIDESRTTVGDPFFQLLSSGEGASPVELGTQANGLRATAGDLVKRARQLDAPDQMRGAQRFLLLVLELRREGIGKIAGKLETARGDDAAKATEAVRQITGQMAVFLASDVVYSQRVSALIAAELEQANLGGQRTVTTRFLTDASWLSPTTVASRLAASVRGRTAGAPAPGTHGHGLVAVSVGGTTLQPGAGNAVTLTGAPVFDIKFANQGENDEFDVVVTVSVQADGRTISGRRTVPESKRGSETNVSIRLDRAPPTDTASEVRVAVAKVPGEQKTDNNRQTYSALFKR